MRPWRMLGRRARPTRRSTPTTGPTSTRISMNTGGRCCPGLLVAAACRAVAARTTNDGAFRSRIVMARHGFGRGEYKYFAYPLPALIAALRQALYPRLVPVANRVGRARWAGVRRSRRRTRVRRAVPRRRADAPDAAAAAVRRRRLQRAAPGSLRLARVPAADGGAAVGAGRDFTGGEFVLTEQRPRMQSRADVVPLAPGDGVIFAVHHRPGGRRARRLSREAAARREPVRSGRRHTLGIILHDAA